MSTFYPRAVRLISNPFVSGYKFLFRTRKPKTEPQKEEDHPLRQNSKTQVQRHIYTDNAIKAGLTPENLGCLPRIKIRASTPSDQRKNSHKTIWSYSHRNVGHRRDTLASHKPQTPYKPNKKSLGGGWQGWNFMLTLPDLCVSQLSSMRRPW